jgi:hypothetical protein
MSGYLVQSRKHVTTLVVEELKMFGYRPKGGSCTDSSSRAGIATSIDDVVYCRECGGEGSSHLQASHFHRLTHRTQARAGVEVAAVELYHNTQVSHKVSCEIDKLRQNGQYT